MALPFGLSRFTYRQDRPKLARWLAVGLAVVLLLNRVMALVWGYHEGRITRWPDALPMHLCDWASFAVIIALVWRGQLAYELAYLWGLSGTFQAVLTPDLTEAFPNPFFIGFFVDHCGIIVSVLFLTWGLAMRPQPGAVLRACGWSQVYLVCAGASGLAAQVEFWLSACQTRERVIVGLFRTLALVYPDLGGHDGRVLHGVLFAVLVCEPAWKGAEGGS